MIYIFRVGIKENNKIKYRQIFIPAPSTPEALKEAYQFAVEIANRVWRTQKGLWEKFQSQGKMAWWETKDENLQFADIPENDDGSKTYYVFLEGSLKTTKT